MMIVGPRFKLRFLESVGFQVNQVDKRASILDNVFCDPLTGLFWGGI